LAIKPFYWVFGPEPYWVGQLARPIEKIYLDRGFIKITYDTEVSWQWPLLLKHQQAHDLFNPAPLIHLTWTDVHPNKEAASVLKTYAEQAHPNCVLLIESGPLSAMFQKSAFFTQVSAFGEIIHARTPPSTEFPRWLQKEASLRSLSLTEEALHWLATIHQGNWFSATQALDRLVLFAPPNPVPLSVVLQDPTQGAQYNLFATLDKLFTHPTSALIPLQTLKQQGQELLPLLGAYMKTVEELMQIERTVRTGKSLENACSQHRIWASRVPFFKTVLAKQLNLLQYYEIGLTMERQIKAYEGKDAWRTLERCFF
jgi:DNA polymerase III delta subunit